LFATAKWKLGPSSRRTPGWIEARLYVVRAEAFDDLVAFIEGYWGPRLRRLRKAAEAADRSTAKK
jgi:hypothetical protein